jgi:methylmalonyl-CoA mutase C-terminal domain/subunit
MLSGAHVALTRKTHEALVAAGGDDIPLVVGGTIPQSDVEKLRAAGAVEVYPTGTALESIVDRMRELTAAARHG